MKTLKTIEMKIHHQKELKNPLILEKICREHTQIELKYSRHLSVGFSCSLVSFRRQFSEIQEEIRVEMVTLCLFFGKEEIKFI